MNKKASITGKHKRCGKKIVLKWNRDNVDWKNVMFSDEKCFNLDESDGFNCYWHNIKKVKNIRCSTHFKGGSLMLWRALSRNSK